MFWRSQIVFSALATGIDQRTPSGETLVQLKVQEVHRGKIPGNVIARQGEEIDCRGIYKVGNRYLVFASNYDASSRLITSIPCAGPIELSSANDDLNYIRKLRRGLAWASLSGRILKNRHESLNEVKILVTGMGKSYTTASDKQGMFRIRLPRAGRYTVTVVGNFVSARSSRGGTRYARPAHGGISYELNLAKGECDYREITLVQVE
jgi:hypothetical protein